MKKIFAILTFFICMNLSATTVVINSIYDQDLIPSSLERISAVEDGLMESLFNFGLIMFTTSNSSTYYVKGAEDAEFMISLELKSEDFIVMYRMVETRDGTVVNSSTINLNDINQLEQRDENKLFFLLGKEIAVKLKEFF